MAVGEGDEGVPAAAGAHTPRQRLVGMLTKALGPNARAPSTAAADAPAASNPATPRGETGGGWLFRRAGSRGSLFDLASGKAAPPSDLPAESTRFTQNERGTAGSETTPSSIGRASGAPGTAPVPDEARSSETEAARRARLSLAALTAMRSLREAPQI